MEFYTVKEIAEMLSVNEETVRRWIRENKIDAERGAGRQGSKVSSESLKKFLDENKGLITGTAASVLGLSTVATLGTAALGVGAAVAGSFIAPISVASVLGMSWLRILKAKDKDKKQIKVELMEKELELEQLAMQLKTEIASKKHELELVESQIAKLREIINK
ncbi:helix-turn-helix domain-containing protein [Clostridium sp.]|uniref:helix-turn-helix domain-containing protein n=1 Tax=Clostridium sp. TaxID=1506 RepID=UPI00321760F3